MKTFNRKNKGFISCVPDVFLATIFLAISAVVVYYAYTTQQQKNIAAQSINKTINKTKIEINKQ